MAARFPGNGAHIAAFAVAAACTIYPIVSQSIAADFPATRDIDGSASSHRSWGLLRVRTIGYRLAKANPKRCFVPTMQTGLILHDIGGFSKTDRPYATRDYGLTFGFGILGIIPESPASRAGLQHGDEIVGLNGRDLSGFASNAIAVKASYDRVEAFEDLLQKELLRGAANLRVRRGNQFLGLVLDSEPGCGGRFVDLSTRRLNAWSNGKYVTVSSAMIGFVADDAELAFVIAHEMAHNILGHNETASAGAGLLSDRPAKTKGSRSRELEADAYAFEIMRRAGYDLEGTLRLLERLKGRTFQGLAFSHPSIKRRMALAEQEFQKGSSQKQATVVAQYSPSAQLREGTPLPIVRRLTPELKFSGIDEVTRPIRLAPSILADVKLAAGAAFAQLPQKGGVTPSIQEFGAPIIRRYRFGTFSRSGLHVPSMLFSVNYAGASARED